MHSLPYQAVAYPQSPRYLAGVMQAWERMGITERDYRAVLFARLVHDLGLCLRMLSHDHFLHWTLLRDTLSDEKRAMVYGKDPSGRWA